MTTGATQADKVKAFVEEIRVQLLEKGADGGRPATVRKRLSSIVIGCGRKHSSQALLRSVANACSAAAIHYQPPIDDPSVPSRTWIHFSTQPIPSESLLFPDERDLRRFVEARLGSGAFRGLELYWERPDKPPREYGLRSGRRIDLLCQERTKSGVGALVAFEFKKWDDDDTVLQIKRYIDELRERFPNRSIKGVIVTGRKDFQSIDILRRFKDYDIRWLCYHVDFEDLTPE